MNQTESMLVELFEKYPRLTTAQIVEHTVLARRTVQKYLTHLVKEERIEAYGEGRGRYYQRVYSHNEFLTHLAVLKNEVLIGKLSYGHGSYAFVYDKKYKGVELLGLFRESENLSSDLYPLFENLLPEYERRNRLLREVKESADILSSLYNIQGDFKFVPYYELYKYISSTEKRPLWHTVKHKILGENSYPNLLEMEIVISDEILEEYSSQEHSSLSGYQHKIDITIDFTKSRILEANQKADYLMKPLNRTMIDYFQKDKNHQKNYYPLLALNEHLFMSFAKNELGLNVPSSAIVLAKGGDFHYVVKRYDRYENYAYGQYDMAQLLTIASDKKYNTDTLTVMEAFVKKVKSKTAPIDMLKFQLYASLIQHSDFHAKNMGILDVGKENYILAPLYDVISIGVYNGEAHDLGLPLSANRRKFGKYNLEDYLLIANRLKIGKIKAKQVIKNTIEIFLDNFPLYIQKTVEFEKEHHIEIQNTRLSKKRFSASLESMYHRRVIQLKKQGILQELGLVEKYGGVLMREKRVDNK
jgi:serine/threonine-protein kinase HipA